MFFSFDGIDGVGKSTQLALFAEWLRQQGHQVVTCRDPGTTPLGEEIRELLLRRDDTTPIGPRSEMLLYMAARAQLVEQVIAPALEGGQTVLTDRYLLSNVVYQGHARGLPVDELWQVGQVATRGVHPDLYLLLDLSPADARGRIDRPLDRMESEGLAFQQALRQGFLDEAERRPAEVAVIDAAQAAAQVQQAVREAAGRVLSGYEPPGGAGTL